MEKIEELPLLGNKEQFWGAVQIYTEKSHVLNRKVCGASNLWIGISGKDYGEDNITERIINKLNEKNSQKGNGKDENVGNKSPNSQQMQGDDSCSELQQIWYIKSILREEGFKCHHREEMKKECSQAKPYLQVEKDETSCSASDVNDAVSDRNILDIPWQQIRSHQNLIVAVIRKIIPKQLQRFVPRLEVVLLDGWKTCVTYVTRLVRDLESVPPRINYSFTFTGTRISFAYFQDKDSEATGSDGNVIWVKNNVLPKLVKWASEIQEDGLNQDQGSLTLVNVQEYNQLYQKLKIKYGQSLVERWPETTDPQKFVFEDVAIATYLLLLWQQERAVKGITKYQTFVDLGCGNGLLVYILSGEGHKGLGIDLRKRNIWDMFPDDVILQEGVVEPSDKHLYPEYDWLIGNHSDELTPWLPVIAAKSKYTTRFFVIPCCAHDFDCKYKRQRAGMSQYADYLEYIKEVGSVCGFQIWEDRLRIPSTKRVCIIGQERTYSLSESHQILKNIDDFIQVRNEFNGKSTVGENKRKSLCGANSIEETASALWSVNFKAREAVQPVRNCTRLNEGVKRDLIATVVNILLEKKCIVEVDIGSTTSVTWDRGGNINLSDLAQRLGHQQLSALKKECGGLQTLLRNHRHMFSIIQGEVSLHVPVPEWKATVPKERIKTKHCWFHLNHYQSCPLPSSACIYAHGDDDIKKG